LNENPRNVCRKRSLILSDAHACHESIPSADSGPSPRLQQFRNFLAFVTFLTFS
jgi:hypothetical protein